MLKLPFLEKVSPDENRFLSININAKDVRCLAFYFDGDVFKIVGSGKVDLPEKSVRNGIVLDKDVVTKSLKEVVGKATGDLGGKLNRVILGLDGGETLGLATTVRLKRTTDGPIQREEVDELYSRIIDASRIQANNKVNQVTGNPEPELDIITTSEIYLKVEGQNVEILEGQRGKNIEACVYNAFAPSYHVNNLQNIIKKSGLSLIAIGSQMYTLVEWLKMPPRELNDLVVISVAEDSTDVGVVFGGGIISTKTLNIGYLHFLDSVKDRMGLSRNETENIFKTYNLGNLASSEAAVVKKCLSEPIRIWVSGLRLLFEDFSGVKTFAPKICLVGCGSQIPDILEALKNEEWTKTVPFKARPEFIKISLLDVQKVVDSTDKIKTDDWLYMCTAPIIYKEIFGPQI
jgi:cell division ATPase FtsA